MLHKTFWMIAAGALMCHGNAWAQDAKIETVQNIRIGETFYHQDNAPKYKKVQDVFSIDRIEYTATNTIVHFRFECFSEQYTGCTFYAPGESGAWVLEGNGGGAVFPVKAVRNVQINGVQETPELTSSRSWWMDFSTNHVTYTCELHFDRLPAHIKVADLVEGIGYEKATDRFNCLNIKLQTWDKAETIALDEAIKEVVALENATEDPANGIIEEVIDAKAKKENPNATDLDNIAQISWKAYPNPAEDFVNIELSVDEPAYIEVLSLNGQQLQQLNTASRISQINVADYPSGVYLVRVTVGEQTTAQQIVKK